MQQTASRSSASRRRSMICNPTRPQLLELIAWSLLEWFYWMALMVFIVWMCAQVQVQTALQRRTELARDLYGYSKIGEQLAVLSTAGETAKAALYGIQTLQNYHLWEGMLLLAGKINPVAAPALEYAEPTLKWVSEIGNEVEAISQLDQTAQGIEHFLAEPSIANLRSMTDSCHEGSEALLLAQEQFGAASAVARPLLESSRDALAVTAYFAHQTAQGNPFASWFITLGEQLDNLAKPTQGVLSLVGSHEEKLAANVLVLKEVSQILADTEYREYVFTLYVFRIPVLWLLDHPFWSNVALILVIVLRLLFAYREVISSGFRSPRPQHGYAVPPAY